MFGDFANGHILGHRPGLFAIEDGARSAELFPLFAGAVDAHGNAFADEVALGFRNGAENGAPGVAVSPFSLVRVVCRC